MRICYVCPHPFERHGGVQRHLKELSNYLHRKGHDVTVIVPGKMRYEDDYILPLGSYVDLKFNEDLGCLSLYVGKSLEELLREKDFDIIHFHEFVPFLSLQILRAARKLRAKKVVTFHANPEASVAIKLLKPVFRRISKPYIAEMDYYIAVSEVPERSARDVYGVEGDIKIIPNGVDTNVFTPYGHKIEEFQDGLLNILFVGRLTERKGIRYLLEAYEILREKRQDIRLIIVGRGYDEKKVRKYQTRLPGIILRTDVSDEELPIYYRSCDVFVAPSTGGESFGIVLTEAMASGKPVVASDIEGYKDVLTGKGSELLVEAKNPEMLAETLDKLLSDEDLRLEFGDWGLKKVQEYSWDVVGDRILELYERLFEE